MKSDITTLSLKTDVKFDELRADIKEIKVDVSKVLSAVHRVTALVEEQNQRNKFVMEIKTLNCSIVFLTRKKFHSEIDPMPRQSKNPMQYQWELRQEKLNYPKASHRGRSLKLKF